MFAHKLFYIELKVARKSVGYTPQIIHQRLKDEKVRFLFSFPSGIMVAFVCVQAETNLDIKMMVMIAI